jgi:hypothetical protein
MKVKIVLCVLAVAAPFCLAQDKSEYPTKYEVLSGVGSLSWCQMVIRDSANPGMTFRVERKSSAFSRCFFWFKGSVLDGRKDKKGITLFVQHGKMSHPKRELWSIIGSG